MPFANKIYRYDPKQLKYIEVKNQKVSYYIRLAGFLLAVFLVVTVLFRFIDTPQKKLLLHKRTSLLEKFDVFYHKVDSLNFWLTDIQEKDELVYRTVLEKKSLPPSIRLAGIGGSELVRNKIALNSTPLVAKLIYETEVLYNKLQVQAQSIQELSVDVKEKEQFYASIPALQPISYEDFNRISSYFGTRVDPFTKIRSTHHGLDYTGDIGDRIYATGAGVVKKVKHSKTGYGNEIIIDHGFGYATRYAHLHDILVHENEKVERGDIIATLGSTGRSTGPHLHYEVLFNNSFQNPILFYPDDMKSEDFEKIVKK